MPALSDANVSSAVVGGRMIQLSGENIRNMSGQDIVNIYQVYVNELSQHVAVMGRDSAARDAAAAEVERLSRDLVRFAGTASFAHLCNCCLELPADADAPARSVPSTTVLCSAWQDSRARRCCFACAPVYY